MNRERSPSAIPKYPLGSANTTNQIPKESLQTSEIYKQAYDRLMAIDPNDCSMLNYSSNTTNTVPPTVQNNAPVVNSPCRRPRSPSHNSNSELMDFEMDPTTKTVTNNRKRSRVENYPSSTASNLPNPDTTNVLSQQMIGVATTDSSLPQANSQQGAVISVTKEAKAFAQSRHPFPPFALRFTSPHIDDHKIVKELCKLLQENKQLDLELAAYRKSNTKCSSNECDLLLFVKNSLSFSILYDDNNWPDALLGLSFTTPSKPSIPPQLSIIVKNVSLSINMDEFANDVRTSYANVQNVIRMKNRHQTDIKWVKVEFSHPGQRDEILNRKRLMVNSLAYNVDEYLAPARVLICSKCMGIGHFRKQCQQELTTCKKCGQCFEDISDHSLTCSLTKCKHCQGDHLANDMKCPLVKQFRADLTKCLLAPISQTNYRHNPSNATQVNASSALRTHQNNLANGRTPWSNNYNVNCNDGANVQSPLMPQFSPAIEVISSKLDDITNNMNQMNSMLEKLIQKNEKFEQFMHEKNTHDEMLTDKFIELVEATKKSTVLLSQHEIKISRQENLFTKIVIPMLDEISRFLYNFNQSNQGRVVDADFKSTVGRMRAQLNNVNTNKIV